MHSWLSIGLYYPEDNTSSWKLENGSGYFVRITDWPKSGAVGNLFSIQWDSWLSQASAIAGRRSYGQFCGMSISFSYILSRTVPTVMLRAEYFLDIQADSLLYNVGKATSLE